MNAMIIGCLVVTLGFVVLRLAASKTENARLLIEIAALKRRLPGFLHRSKGGSTCPPPESRLIARRVALRGAHAPHSTTLAFLLAAWRAQPRPACTRAAGDSSPLGGLR